MQFLNKFLSLYSMRNIVNPGMKSISIFATLFKYSFCFLLRLFKVFTLDILQMLPVVTTIEETWNFS